MLEIIPTKNDIQSVDKNIVYISNSISNSITAKYNYAINNYVLNSDEELICFHHDDCSFLIDKDKVEHKVLKGYICNVKYVWKSEGIIVPLHSSIVKLSY